MNEIQQEKDRFFLVGESGETAAEIDFRISRPGVLRIDHTWVSESLRGRGIAQSLVSRTVEYARANGLKILPVCSYAKAFLEGDAQYRDILFTEANG